MAVSVAFAALVSAIGGLCGLGRSRLLLLTGRLYNKTFGIALEPGVLDHGVDELAYPVVALIGMAARNAIIVIKLWLEKIARAQLPDQYGFKILLRQLGTKVPDHMIPSVFELWQFGIARVFEVHERGQLEADVRIRTDTVELANCKEQLPSTDLFWDIVLAHLVTPPLEARYEFRIAAGLCAIDVLRDAGPEFGVQGFEIATVEEFIERA